MAANFSKGEEEDITTIGLSASMDVGVKLTVAPHRNRRSAVARYTPEFRKEVVDFGLRNRPCVTSKKFNVTSTIVGAWSKKALRIKDDRTENDKSNLSKYTPEFRRKVVEFGMSHKQAEAGRKFNVPASTVGEWVMKALRVRDDKAMVTPLNNNDDDRKESEELVHVSNILVSCKEEENDYIDRVARRQTDDAQDDIARVKNKKYSHNEHVLLQPSPRSNVHDDVSSAVAGPDNSNISTSEDKSTVAYPIKSDPVPGSGFTPNHCGACGAVLAANGKAGRLVRSPFFSSSSGGANDAAPAPIVMMVPVTEAIPLPGPEVLEEEPMYVNAKQYDRIVKRRWARAKLEADGRIPRERKIRH